MKTRGKEQMIEMKKAVPCVYFVSDGIGNVKVGVASDIKKRLSELQVCNANELTVINICYCNSKQEALELESGYHLWLGIENRVRGEWYAENAVREILECDEDTALVIPPVYVEKGHADPMYNNCSELIAAAIFGGSEMNG